ncbi:MAG: fluoride efflux transporter CrcB [Gammaproteobacteria bacterium]|nr:fluoride efflux transporter CrcB [Gammaproteobacteria bacterium]MCW8910134.1 fluoride efflux transporter CrcB [Gammaproteobacteria bacterium]MCW9005031.1 fluoride efflux transporter CrcB [Gammaproteobacteria bacterium]MCW9055079.1 fluoride efflux transporter CrcB [Gammaproteobacteria bacterium]
MKALLYVAMGGALGAVMRYGISSGIYSWFGRSFPYGTLVVNVVGSFLIGIFSILLIEKFNVSHEFRLALVVGVLGALTTFSTFSWDTLDLMQQGLMQKAMLNVLMNVVMCIAAAWLGAQWAKSMV